MMYPYMTLNDDTEITHSEMKPDGRMNTPDKQRLFAAFVSYGCNVQSCFQSLNFKLCK